MQHVFNPLMTMYQTQLEASRRFADAVFSGTEKIDRVVIGATHRALTEQLNLAEEMATMRTPQSFGSRIRSGSMQHNPGNMMNYQKEIMRIFVDMQAEISRSLQDCIGKYGALAPASSVRPSSTRRQTDDTANPVAGMLSVWESAFKEVTDLVRENMATARSSGENIAAEAQQTASAVSSVVDAAVEEGAESASMDAVAAGDKKSHSSHSSSSGGKKK
jgi:hypothetical protein